VRILNVDIDPPHIANLDTVEKHEAAPPQSRGRTWNTDTQKRGFPAIANCRRPIDEGESGHDGSQRKDTDNDVVGPGFHSPPVSMRVRRDQADGRVFLGNTPLPTAPRS